MNDKITVMNFIKTTPFPYKLKYKTKDMKLIKTEVNAIVIVSLTKVNSVCSKLFEIWTPFSILFVSVG